MSKAKAITLGLFTVWPILYIVLFVGIIFLSMILTIINPHSGDMPAVFVVTFMFIIPFHLLTMLEIFVLLTIYIIHVFKADDIPQDKKALWAVVIFLGNIIAMPIYWYLYIWRTRREPSVFQ